MAVQVGLQQARLLLVTQQRLALGRGHEHGLHLGTGADGHQPLAAPLGELEERQVDQGGPRASVLPAHDYPWRPGQDPANKIPELNQRIKQYAASVGAVYCDFYSAMVDDRNGLPEELSGDGVHPNKAGYEVMNPLVEHAIARAFLMWKEFK